MQFCCASDDEYAEAFRLEVVSEAILNAATAAEVARPALPKQNPQPAQPARLPVLRPRLPSRTELLPFLEFIDEGRCYSNYGPLASRLEALLSRYFGYEETIVASVSSATAGLTATLLALNIPAGSLCIMPSWTFAATPHAAVGAGLVPWFHDVDRNTWALNPHEVAASLKRIRRRVGCVLAVSPFGAPLPVEAWHAFEDSTGIPVVIDAAAGFDTVRASSIPSVVSLHATKILGAGEGGFVVVTDAALRQHIAACSNFGFSGSRTATAPALNAKMSEYHAAVALASLYTWPATRLRHCRVTEWYLHAIAKLDRVSLQPGYGDCWVTGTTNVILPPNSAAAVAAGLLDLGIETRSWWGKGCHSHPAFAGCPRGPLPVTRELGDRVLGLPHFPDMQEADVERVVKAMGKILDDAH